MVKTPIWLQMFLDSSPFITCILSVSSQSCSGNVRSTLKASFYTSVLNCIKNQKLMSWFYRFMFFIQSRHLRPTPYWASPTSLQVPITGRPMMAHCGGSGLDFTTSIGTIRHDNWYLACVDCDEIPLIGRSLIIDS